MDHTQQELRHLHLKIVQAVAAEDSKALTALLGERHQYRAWVTPETEGWGLWGPIVGRIPFADACADAIHVLDGAGAYPPSKRWVRTTCLGYIDVDYPYLMVAAKHGQVDAMILLLNQGQFYDDELIFELTNQALIRGHIDIFTRLFQHQYLKKDDALLHAVKYGRLDIIQDLSLADSGNAARAATKAGQSGFDDLFIYLMNLVPLGDRQQVAQKVYEKVGSLRILQHCLPLLDPGWLTRNQRNAFKNSIGHAPAGVIRYFLLQGERPVNEWIRNAFSSRIDGSSCDGQTPEREESLLFLCELLDQDYPIQEYILSGAASRGLWRLIEMFLSRAAFKIGTLRGTWFRFLIKQACIDGKTDLVRRLLDMDSCPTHEYYEVTYPNTGHLCLRIKYRLGCSVGIVLNNVCCGFRSPQAMEVVRQVEDLARQRFVDTATNFADKWRFSGLGRYMIDLLSRYRLRPVEAIVRPIKHSVDVEPLVCSALRRIAILVMQLLGYEQGEKSLEETLISTFRQLEKLPGCEKILRPFLEEVCTYALEDRDELVFKIFYRVFRNMHFDVKSKSKGLWVLAAISGGLAGVVKDLLHIPYAVTYGQPPIPFTEDYRPSAFEPRSQLAKRTWIMSHQAEPYHRAVTRKYYSRGGLWLPAARQCWDSEGEIELVRSEMLLDYAFAGNHLGLIKHMTSRLGVDCRKRYFLGLFLPKYDDLETRTFVDRQYPTLEAIEVFLAGVDEYNLAPRLRPDFTWPPVVRAGQSRICDYYTTTGPKTRKSPLSMIRIHRAGPGVSQIRLRTYR
ncbi:hypothetical protein DFS34DRAFT_590166 [Phlyctochytrium arcticum]|nr:hypothetical protein DFS34DRAFT_590166 [Phlyctochytrium arcticum]